MGATLRARVAAKPKARPEGTTCQCGLLAICRRCGDRSVLVALAIGAYSVLAVLAVLAGPAFRREQAAHACWGGRGRPGPDVVVPRMDAFRARVTASTLSSRTTSTFLMARTSPRTRRFRLLGSAGSAGHIRPGTRSRRSTFSCAWSLAGIRPPRCSSSRQTVGEMVARRLRGRAACTGSGRT